MSYDLTDSGLDVTNEDWLHDSSTASSLEWDLFLTDREEEDQDGIYVDPMHHSQQPANGFEPMPLGNTEAMFETAPDSAASPPLDMEPTDGLVEQQADAETPWQEVTETTHHLEIQIHSSKEGFNGKFEVAEMPSYKHYPTSPDGLYHCPEEGGKCEVESRGFSTRGEFRKHMKTHFKPVQCPHCPHTAAEQRDMRRHVEHGHQIWAARHWTVKTKFNCGICKEKSFTRKCALQKHRKRFHSTSA
ncbi:hypothetical protein PT974_04935 [Cladobotryum mycophilum]|uniref:C2H2-type domain-containing protein n=1 Tax=Cladobotryum mycophilum TaxID=491253 RepID=A0ABR0SRW1_9HYPO